MQQFVETESSRLTQLLSIHAHGRLHVLLTKELLVAAGGLSGKGAVLRLVLGFACGSAETEDMSFPQGNLSCNSMLAGDALIPEGARSRYGGGRWQRYGLY